MTYQRLPKQLLYYAYFHYIDKNKIVEVHRILYIVSLDAHQVVACISKNPKPNDNRPLIFGTYHINNGIFKDITDIAF